jgi:hypothetical protein
LKNRESDLVPAPERGICNPGSEGGVDQLVLLGNTTSRLDLILSRFATNFSKNGIETAGREFDLNKKHSGVLHAIFADPVRANISWRDVISLLRSLGAAVVEGSGSRVGVELNGRTAVFHRPHPQKEVGKPMVRALRDFLSEAGVRGQR